MGIVKDEVIKSVSDTSDVPTSELSNLSLKPELPFHGQNHPVDHSPIFKLKNGNDFDYQNKEFLTESQCDAADHYNDSFFNRNREIKSHKNQKYHTTIFNTYNGHPHYTNQITQIGGSPIKNLKKMPYYNQGKNPWDRYENSTKRAICYSINHWEQICPDNKNKNIFIVNEEVLHQSDFDNPN